MNRSKKRLSYRREIPEDTAERLLNKGNLTAEDLREAYLRGVKDGIREGIDYHLPFFLASTAIALNRLHQFGPKRLEVIYNLAAQIQMEEITVQEAIDRCKWETRFDVTQHIKDYSPV